MPKRRNESTDSIETNVVKKKKGNNVLKNISPNISTTDETNTSRTIRQKSTSTATTITTTTTTTTTTKNNDSTNSNSSSTSNNNNKYSNRNNNNDSSSNNRNAMMIDGDVSDQEEYETDEDVESTATYERPTDGLSSSEAPGIISRIMCENFMCHESLNLPLNNRVNFITGRNGSGKSAVIAALQLCLGATASETQRGKAIKDLIRRDHGGHAYLNVTLQNPEGDGAFRYAEYGESITIQRTIQNKGGSTYQLYNHNEMKKYVEAIEKGKDYKRKPTKPANGLTAKKEILQITDKFNINVSNPCNILDQETAGKFLNSKAEDKYGFFMRATELETIENDISRLDGLIPTALKNLKEGNSKKETLESKVDRRKEKLDQINNLLTIDDDIEKEKIRLAWANVAEEEARLGRRNKMISEMQPNVDQKLEKVNIEQANLNKMSQELEAETNLELTYQERKTAKHHDLDKVNLELRKIKKPIKTKEREIKEAAKKIDNYKRQQIGFEKKKKDLVTAIDRARLQQDNESQRRVAKLRQELRELYDLIEKDKRNLPKTEDHRNSLEQSSANAENAYRNEEINFRNASENVKSCQQQLQRLKREESSNQSRSNPLAMYSSGIQTLRRVVEQNVNLFDVKPIVPVGEFVNLKAGQENLALAAEAMIGQAMASALVSTARDRKTLFRMIQQNNIRSVTVNKLTHRCNNGNRKHLSQSERAPNNLTTIYDVLEFPNSMQGNWVHNFILFNTQVEKKVICNSRGEMDTIMGNPPRPVNEAISIDAKRGARSARGRGNVANFPRWNAPTRVNFLKPANVSQADSLKNAIGGATQDLARSKQILTEMRGKKDQAKQESDGKKRELRKAIDYFSKLQKRYDTSRQKKRSKENELGQLEQELEQNGDNDQEDNEEVKRLKQQMEDVQNNIEVNHSLIQENTVTIDKKMAEIQVEKAKIGPVQETIEALTEEIDHMETEQSSKTDKLYEMKEQYKKLKHKIAKCKGSYDAAKHKLEKIKKDREKVQKKVNLQIQQTENAMGARIILEENETKESIQHKIDSLREKQETEKKSLNLPDHTLVKKQYATALKNLEEHNLMVSYITRTYNDLKQMRKDRKKRFKGMRSYVSKMTGVMFNTLLSENKQAGHVNWSHTNKSLDVEVNLDAEKNNAAVKNTKQLSGGERSTTTLVLLLSLLFCVDCPFTVMDEFDVCMDEKRRSISLEQLVNMAEKNEDRQFIFVTPHSLESLGERKKRDYITIYKMDKKDNLPV